MSLTEAFQSPDLCHGLFVIDLSSKFSSNCIIGNRQGKIHDLGTSRARRSSDT